jgi:hypothetical protein
MISSVKCDMDIAEIRLSNLRGLVSRYKSQREFADVVETSPAYISQTLNKTLARGKPRSIGSDFARKIEEKLGLDHGWMDQLHSDDVEVSIRQPVKKTFDSAPEPPQSIQKSNFEIKLAHEQGRAEALRAICILLIQHDPIFAEKILRSFSQNPLISNTINSFSSKLQGNDQNYAQAVLEAWNNASTELLEFAQGLHTAQ